MEMRELLSIYLPRKDLGILVCSESDCESPRKYLFKDLDGRALGLPPPVSVFPKIEAEWTGSFFNTGQFYLNSMSPVEGTSMGRSWFGCVVQWEQHIPERNWAIELASVPVSCSTHLYLRNVGCLRDVTIALFCPPWDCLWSMSKVQTPNTTCAQVKRMVLSLGWSLGPEAALSVLSVSQCLPWKQFLWILNPSLPPELNALTLDRVVD